MIRIRWMALSLSGCPGLQLTNIAMEHPACVDVFLIRFQEDFQSYIFTGEYWRWIWWCDLLWRWVDQNRQSRAVIFRFGLSWQSCHISIFYVRTIHTPCLLHSTFGRRIMSLLALCWPKETVWGPRVKIILLLSLRPSCRRFLHTYSYSLCHYMSFRYCVIGWNPNYYHLSLPFLQVTHDSPVASDMDVTTTFPKWRLLHQIRGGFLETWVNKMLVQIRPILAWRHEGHLPFWDILGRWLY